MSRVRYLVVAVFAIGAAVAVVRYANRARAFASGYRTVEGRVAAPEPHRPYRRLQTASAFAIPRSRGRLPAALLGETDALQQIHASTDADFLTDFSAAALERPGDRELLLAYEAADRAWQLSHAAPSGWNRALAAQRIGMDAFAERAWRDVIAREPDAAWAGEAEARRAESEHRAKAPPPPTLELFFQRDLFLRVRAGEVVTDRTPQDRLASDVANAVARLRTETERQRLRDAVDAYLRASDAVDRSEVAVASEAYFAAESAFDALHVPLLWIARDQRLRCDCSLSKPGCLDSWRVFRRGLAKAGQYPWLTARGAYGEGQTLYRQGRVYEAAQHFEDGLVELEKLGDVPAAAQMHILLTNVYAAGGETDLALHHYLQGLAVRNPPEIVDRRRRVLEDGIVVMLRHGYVSTAELLLDDLDAAATTAAAKVSKAMLRGVAAFRRGDLRGASGHFREAHALLRALPDESTRADLQFRLAIAEAGSGMQATSAALADLDAGVTTQSGPEFSIWLPQLLAERGAAFESANDLVRAEADYLRAIDVLESREPRIDQTVLSLGLATRNESSFDRAIRLFLQQGRTVDALSIAERAGALRISALHARGAGVRDVYRPLRTRGDGVAEARRALRPGEVAVTQYLLRDELVAWVITREQVRVVRKPVRREELLRHAARLQSCRGDGCDAAIAALSGALLQPWIEDVPADVTLLLQPAAELEAVPFAVLETREREPLVRRNASATVPTLRAFAEAAKQDAARSANAGAFFAAASQPGGNLEALPRAVAEVTKAAERYAGARVEPRATRARFLAQSPDAALVHFAGHILVDPVRPLFSAFAFDGGEMLYVHELDASSFAKARLIVLSACDSGKSPRPVMSVANALLSQDVPSVVYTFRGVDDEVAEEFALAFHRALGDGQSRAEAVREAQLSLMRNHPGDSMIWAAFALAGAAGPMREER